MTANEDLEVDLSLVQKHYQVFHAGSQSPLIFVVHCKFCLPQDKSFSLLTHCNPAHQMHFSAFCSKLVIKSYRHVGKCFDKIGWKFEFFPHRMIPTVRVKYIPVVLL